MKRYLYVLALAALCGIANGQTAPEPPAQCPHIGVQWVDPKIAGAGSVSSCGDSVTLTVSYGEASATLTWTGTGCPDYLLIAPGHNEQTPKIGYYTDAGQRLPWIILDYFCDWRDRCVGGTTYSANTVEFHFSQFVCPLLPPH